MVIYGYLDFRSGSRDAISPLLLTTDPVSKYLVNHRNPHVKEVVRALHGTFPLKVAFKKFMNFIDKSFPRKETYRWKKLEILNMIQICAEFVYLRRRLMFMNFKQMMSDVEEVVEDVLCPKIGPWMVENGGISGCYS